VTKPPRTRLEEAFKALRNDLISDDGPQISTLRNYRYAIIPYEPEDEFELRRQVQETVGKLSAGGWHVLSLSLQKLLLNRLRNNGTEILARMIAAERSAAAIAPDRGLNYVRDKMRRELDGAEGIAADVSREIATFAETNPDKVDHTVVFLGRVGALYPFFRVSALLKHLDGKTRNVPAVVLYPGQRRGDTELSFMGELAPDRDYRPRIYP
jgi:hypothetical protein